MVGDVARYPEFVPWITSMRAEPIAGDGGEGVTRLRAEAGVGFSFLKERFTTKVVRDARTRVIIVSLISGPFRRLMNQWRFEPHPSGCRVGFEIDFEFRSRVLTTLLRANFGLAVDRLIACFETRARDLYGAADVATVTSGVRAEA